MGRWNAASDFVRPQVFASSCRVWSLEGLSSIRLIMSTQ